MKRILAASYFYCLLGFELASLCAWADGGYGAANNVPRTTQNPGDVPFASGTYSDTLKNWKSPAAKAMAQHQSGFADCDQACLYQKANENLTLQIAYLEKKRAYLKDATNASEIEAVLGAFCGEKESKEDCKQRYLDEEKFIVLKARTSLGQNFETVAKLECNQRDIMGKCLGPYAPVVVKGQIDPLPNGSTIYAQSTYISTASEIDQLLAMKKLQGVTDSNDQSMNEWVTGGGRTSGGKEKEGYVRSLQPKPEDFIKFKKIPRPGSRSPNDFLVIPEKNGKAYVIDQDAYRLALANYNELFGPGQNGTGSPGSGGPKHDLQKIYQNKTLNEKKREALDHYERSKANPDSARGAYAETHDDFAKQLDDHAAKSAADQAKKKGFGTTAASPAGNPGAAGSFATGDRPIKPIRGEPVQQGGQIQEDTHFLYLTPDRIQFEPKDGTRPVAQPSSVPSSNPLNQVTEPKNDAYTTLDFN